MNWPQLTLTEQFAQRLIEEEYDRREAIAWDFLVSGAFLNELHVVETVMQPDSWRII